MELIPACRSLDLSHNALLRLENLSSLTRLRVLVVPFNRLRSIDGLDHLLQLETLDLEGNQIRSIPSSITINRALTDLRLKDNNLRQLDDLYRLSSLPNLAKLSLEGNPCMKLPQARPFAIFALPSLHVLDGDAVLLADRQEASERFNRAALVEAQQRLQAVADLHQATLSKLSSAETQLEADERVMSGLRGRVEALVQRDSSLSAQLEDALALVQQNAVTISSSQARIAHLEQEISARSRSRSRGRQAETMLAVERDGRLQAQRRLDETQTIMGHQLKVARGLLSCKSQRMAMSAQIRSLSRLEEAGPWKTAAQTLLLLADQLQRHLIDQDAMGVQAIRRVFAERDALEAEVEALHRHRGLVVNESPPVPSVVIVPAPRRERDAIRMRRVMLANVRLRAALQTERSRQDDGDDELRLQVEAQSRCFREKERALHERIAKLEEEVKRRRHERPSLQVKVEERDAQNHHLSDRQRRRSFSSKEDDNDPRRPPLRPISSQPRTDGSRCIVVRKDRGRSLHDDESSSRVVVPSRGAPEPVDKRQFRAVLERLKIESNS